MFLFKYKCINCKYNISFKGEFLLQDDIFIKFKNAVNTFVRYFMHISPLPPDCGLLLSLLPRCYRWHTSLLTPYIKLISQSFSYCARILCLLLHCLSVSCRHIIINVSWSKRGCSVFSVFGGVYFSWSVYCWFHELDGWPVQSCYVKPHPFLPHEREMYLLCPF